MYRVPVPSKSIRLCCCCCLVLFAAAAAAAAVAKLLPIMPRCAAALSRFPLAAARLLTGQATADRLSPVRAAATPASSNPFLIGCRSREVDNSEGTKSRRSLDSQSSTSWVHSSGTRSICSSFRKLCTAAPLTHRSGGCQLARPKQ